MSVLRLISPAMQTAESRVRSVMCVVAGKGTSKCCDEVMPVRSWPPNGSPVVGSISDGSSSTEFSIVTVRKTRVEQLVAEGHWGARAVRRV